MVQYSKSWMLKGNPWMASLVSNLHLQEFLQNAFQGNKIIVMPPGPHDLETQSCFDLFAGKAWDSVPSEKVLYATYCTSFLPPTFYFNYFPSYLLATVRCRNHYKWDDAAVFVIEELQPDSWFFHHYTKTLTMDQMQAIIGWVEWLKGEVNLLLPECNRIIEAFTNLKDSF